MKIPALVHRCSFAAARASLLPSLLLTVCSTAAALFPPPPLPTGPAVIYSPNTTRMVEGPQPIINQFDLSVTSPSNVGSPTTVELSLVVESRPEGVDEATAKACVQFRDSSTGELISSLLFGSALETRTVQVTVSFPIGAPTGEFKYFITTPGWAAGTSDHGMRINAQISPPIGLPPPTVSIPGPVDGANFIHTAGGAPVPVAIAVEGAAPGSTKMLSVEGFLSGVDANGETILPEMPLALLLTGFSNPTITGEVVVPLSQAGLYTIRAVATSTGGSAEATSHFSVELYVPPPPTVMFTETPAAAYDYTAGSPALQIPFAFQGESFTGGIRSLTATLNGVPVTVETNAIGELVATATGALELATGGEYDLEVTATDDFGSASIATSFVVNVISVPTERPVRGIVFFDVNSNHRCDGADYGLPGVEVTLIDLRGHRWTTTTDADGAYVFNASPGIYVVWVQRLDGFTPTTLLAHLVVVCKSAVTVPATGFALNFCELRKMCANGYSHGFWKTNLEKALSGKAKGAQVSAATLRAYTEEISTLALEPFDGLTMPAALARLNAKGSAADVLLAKQLVASEYNYANGAYIGGSGTLTYAFIYFGEYVLANPCHYSRSQVTFVKDWFDAYNNSHGGKVLGPLH